MPFNPSTWESLIDEKVCAIDLDDTLSYSIEYWVAYVNRELCLVGLDEFKTLGQIKDKLSYNQYRQLKYKYRTSGEKIYIKPIEGASELTRALKEKGYKVIIITARPADIIPELGKLTYSWLEENNILYDGVLFNRNKHIEILLKYPTLRFYINDHRTESNLVAQWGYPCFLINNQYNQGVTNKGVKRVDKLMEILDSLEEIE